MANRGAGLIDIIGPPPPAPAPEHTPVLLAGLLIVLAVAALSIWTARRWPVWHARLVTRRLCRAHEAGTIDARTAAYDLGSALRRYFRVTRLDAAAAPPGIARDWSVVLRRLDRLRYGRSPGPGATVAQWRRLSVVTARRLAASGERGRRWHGRRERRS